MLFLKCFKSRSYWGLLVVAMLTSALSGQDRPASRFDLFTGYSWLHPGYDTLVPNAQENIARGFTVSGTYFFNRHVGLGADFGDHLGCCCPRILTVQAGPTIRFPGQHVTLFLHALAGLHRMALLDPFGVDNNVGVIAGGGLDVALFRHVSLRLIQADYEYAPHSYGPLQPNLNGVRLSAGLVWQFGSIGPPLALPRASCSVNPVEVFSGEPVNATATGADFNPRRTIAYSWSGPGTQATAHEASTQVDTAGLAPGSYTLVANLSDGSKRGVASCNSRFSVKQSPPPLRPPTASCSASPTSVRVGDPSTITVTADNPDNRRLSYNYTASNGRVTGNGATASLDTAGRNAGPITVTATVSDDRGLTATCNAVVNLEDPPQPIQASLLNTCQFSLDTKRPWRVDNACKAILDEVALRLQRDSDSRLVIVGHADPTIDNTHGARFAAQRAANSKQYLAGGEAKQQIDPRRIEVRTGADTGQTADYWLVPPGATFNAQATQSVDENALKPPVRKRSQANQRN